MNQSRLASECHIAGQSKRSQSRACSDKQSVRNSILSRSGMAIALLRIRLHVVTHGRHSHSMELSRQRRASPQQKLLSLSRREKGQVEPPPGLAHHAVVWVGHDFLNPATYEVYAHISLHLISYHVLVMSSRNRISARLSDLSYMRFADKCSLLPARLFCRCEHLDTYILPLYIGVYLGHFVDNWRKTHC